MTEWFFGNFCTTRQLLQHSSRGVDSGCAIEMTAQRNRRKRNPPQLVRCNHDTFPILLLFSPSKWIHGQGGCDGVKIKLFMVFRIAELIFQFCPIFFHSCYCYLTDKLLWMNCYVKWEEHIKLLGKRSSVHCQFLHNFCKTCSMEYINQEALQDQITHIS